MASAGLAFDPEKNVFWGCHSTDDSRVKVLVIPTDEELVIAAALNVSKKNQ